MKINEVMSCKVTPDGVKRQNSGASWNLPSIDSKDGYEDETAIVVMGKDPQSRTIIGYGAFFTP